MLLELRQLSVPPSDRCSCGTLLQWLEASPPPLAIKADNLSRYFGSPRRSYLNMGADREGLA